MISCQLGFRILERKSGLRERLGFKQEPPNGHRVLNSPANLTLFWRHKRSHRAMSCERRRASSEDEHQRVKPSDVLLVFTRPHSSSLLVFAHLRSSSLLFAQRLSSSLVFAPSCVFVRVHSSSQLFVCLRSFPFFVFASFLLAFK